MKSFVYRGEPAELSRVLTRECTLSYGTVQKLFRKKDVRVNGVRASSDRSVRDGDRIEAYLPDRNPLDGRILYSDDNVLVVDKPPRLDTYVAAAEAEKLTGAPVFPVHRLDRNTSGVLIFARNEAAKEAIEACFKEGRTEKRYRAEVFGHPKSASATLTAYLRKDSDESRVTISDRPAPGFLRIVTGYRVLSETEETSTLEVTLYTGRTHQIRAHLSHLGYPIVGDEKYGNHAANRRSGKRFQCLRCVSLTLRGLPEFLSEISDRTFEACP